MFVCCWGFMSLLNIWGHVAAVPTCNSGTLTDVLLHRNAMPQTQDMAPHPVTVYRRGADLSCFHWCGTSHWNTQLPILMSRVRPDLEILPRPSTHTSKTQLYDAVTVVVSRKIGRKWTIPTRFWSWDLWCVNPLHYPLAHSCFNISLYIVMLMKTKLYIWDLCLGIEHCIWFKGTQSQIGYEISFLWKF